MKILLAAVLICGALLFAGCIQSSRTEQRVVQLPDNDPNSTLETAAQIGKSLLESDLGANIRQNFPTLTQQQMQGTYLTWNAATFNGKASVFFLTGIRYTGSLPEAKAVADYCEEQVKKAVAQKFPNATLK